MTLNSRKMPLRPGQPAPRPSVPASPSPRRIRQQYQYGAKMTAQTVAALKEARSFLFLYGQGQIVRYHSAVVLAKFLGGRAVRAVWVRLEDENGLPKAPRLLISTEITMTAREIIDAYALRWTIEPMFCSLKHGIGVKETWQRRRQTLHRWVQILSTAFALTQMMAVHDPVIARQLAIVAPGARNA